MNKICTTIEQSKKLVELGLDVNTADMYYQWYSETESALKVGKGSKKLNADCPAWSLSALLELMPLLQFKAGFTRPRMLKDEINGQYQYMVYYQESYCTSRHSTPLDAAFEMVVYLLENKEL